ncbi:UNVERIFIED_CONTAM: hypothetical protein HDU68_010003 [Siphonaria sp. JEL0065]|nr:hypothetical protein HDU68_010003 [Siphonaria sp. JEL0065]
MAGYPITLQTRDHCVSYELPKGQVETMLSDVCSSERSRPACTLFRLCSASKSNSQICASNFSLLSSACESPLPLAASRGCRTYSSLCRGASLVGTCRKTIEREMPNTKTDAIQLINIVCAVKWDKTLCTQCNDETDTDACRDPLTIYHQLCASSSRSSHPSCSKATQLCKYSQSPLDGLACPEDPSSLTPFLHSAFDRDHFLFEWAVPSNPFSVLLALGSAFFIGFLYELLINLRLGWEVSWKAELLASIEQEEETLPSDETEATTEEGSTENASARIPLLQRVQRTISQRLRVFSIIIARQVRVRGLRSVLKALEGIVLVSLVLVVATFNVGLCLAVVCGLAVGAFLFV